jgi:hypothetical protein
MVPEKSGHRSRLFSTCGRFSRRLTRPNACPEDEGVEGQAKC